jgi:hypothetical protein
MNRKPKPILSCAVLLALAVPAIGQVPGDPPPPLPETTPVGGVELVLARPFTLQTPYEHEWRAERPEVAGGLLLVLKVDPAMVWPRQVAEPVLFVGGQTAERVNLGHRSGHVIAIVPAPVDARGRVTLDLSEAPIFFGAPALPEQIDAEAASAELAAAREAGLQPPSEKAVEAALTSQVRFPGRDELTLYASDLIESWSPDEKDLVAGLRAPRPGG